MNSEISTYTISVYELQEYSFDFGLNDYPIWDEKYRVKLNTAILEFYMFREIGYVNPMVWRQRLRNKMDIIMRNKYNDLYKQKAIPFNALYTMELYEEYTHKIKNDGLNSNNGTTNYNTDGNNTSASSQNNHIATTDTTTNNTNNLGLTSQFPSQEMTENDLTSNLFIDNATKTTGINTVTGISGVDTTIGGTNTATNKGVDKTVNTSAGTNTNNMDETYNKKTYGSASDLSFAHAMTQYYDYVEMYQLDQQVIAELKELFMQIW